MPKPINGKTNSNANVNVKEGHTPTGDSIILNGRGYTPMGDGEEGVVFAPIVNIVNNTGSNTMQDYDALMRTHGAGFQIDSDNNFKNKDIELFNNMKNIYTLLYQNKELCKASPMLSTFVDVWKRGQYDFNMFPQNNEAYSRLQAAEQKYNILKLLSNDEQEKVKKLQRNVLKLIVDYNNYKKRMLGKSINGDNIKWMFIHGYEKHASFVNEANLLEKRLIDLRNKYNIPLSNGRSIFAGPIARGLREINKEIITIPYPGQSDEGGKDEGPFSEELMQKINEGVINLVDYDKRDEVQDRIVNRFSAQRHIDRLCVIDLTNPYEKRSAEEQYEDAIKDGKQDFLVVTNTVDNNGNVTGAHQVGFSVDLKNSEVVVFADKWISNDIEEAEKVRELVSKEIPKLAELKSVKACVNFVNNGINCPLHVKEQLALHADGLMEPRIMSDLKVNTEFQIKEKRSNEEDLKHSKEAIKLEIQGLLPRRQFESIASSLNNSIPSNEAWKIICGNIKMPQDKKDIFQDKKDILTKKISDYNECRKKLEEITAADKSDCKRDKQVNNVLDEYFRDFKEMDSQIEAFGITGRDKNICKAKIMLDYMANVLPEMLKEQGLYHEEAYNRKINYWISLVTGGGFDTCYDKNKKKVLLSDGQLADLGDWLDSDIFKELPEDSIMHKLWGENYNELRGGVRTYSNNQGETYCAIQIADNNFDPTCENMRGGKPIVANRWNLKEIDSESPIWKSKYNIVSYNMKDEAGNVVAHYFGFKLDDKNKKIDVYVDGGIGVKGKSEAECLKMYDALSLMFGREQLDGFDVNFYNNGLKNNGYNCGMHAIITAKAIEEGAKFEKYNEPFKKGESEKKFEKIDKFNENFDVTVSQCQKFYGLKRAIEANNKKSGSVSKVEIEKKIREFKEASVKKLSRAENPAEFQDIITTIIGPECEELKNISNGSVDVKIVKLEKDAREAREAREAEEAKAQAKSNSNNIRQPNEAKRIVSEVNVKGVSDGAGDYDEAVDEKMELSKQLWAGEKSFVSAPRKVNLRDSVIFDFEKKNKERIKHRKNEQFIRKSLFKVKNNDNEKIDDNMALNNFGQDYIDEEEEYNDISLSQKNNTSNTNKMVSEQMLNNQKSFKNKYLEYKGNDCQISVNKNREFGVGMTIKDGDLIEVEKYDVSNMGFLATLHCVNNNNNGDVTGLNLKELIKGNGELHILSETEFEKKLKEKSKQNNQQMHNNGTNNIKEHNDTNLKNANKHNNINVNNDARVRLPMGDIIKVKQRDTNTIEANAKNNINASKPKTQREIFLDSATNKEELLNMSRALGLARASLYILPSDMSSGKIKMLIPSDAIMIYKDKQLGNDKKEIKFPNVILDRGKDHKPVYLKNNTHIRGEDGAKFEEFKCNVGKLAEGIGFDNSEGRVGFIVLEGTREELMRKIDERHEWIVEKYSKCKDQNETNGSKELYQQVKGKWCDNRPKNSNNEARGLFQAVRNGLQDYKHNKNSGTQKIEIRRLARVFGQYHDAGFIKGVVRQNINDINANVRKDRRGSNFEVKNGINNEMHINYK